MKNKYILIFIFSLVFFCCKTKKIEQSKNLVQVKALDSTVVTLSNIRGIEGTFRLVLKPSFQSIIDSFFLQNRIEKNIKNLLFFRFLIRKDKSVKFFEIKVAKNNISAKDISIFFKENISINLLTNNDFMMYYKDSIFVSFPIWRDGKILTPVR